MPGDYYFREQWAFHNTGQLFYCYPWIAGDFLCFYVGTPDADIDAPEAWAMSTGHHGHRRGRSTPASTTPIPISQRTTPAAYDFVHTDGDPMDDHGHGTHVAGTMPPR